MTLPRRLGIVPRQTSTCAGCGREITERRRRPCLQCGSINRIHLRLVRESLISIDRAS
jgi:hypothetical protein